MNQTHSNADLIEGGRLHAPAAARNGPHIVAALRGHLPNSGTALEIASGTGQHAVSLARAFPGLVWQPSDIAPERLASVDAWRAREGRENMRAAIWLDATDPAWKLPLVDVVFGANLMHLISREHAANVLRGAARVLKPGGLLCLYGPFRTDGTFRSTGDVSFDSALRAQDPTIGYKDLEWIESTAEDAGMSRRSVIEMPANNLIWIGEKG